MTPYYIIAALTIIIVVLILWQWKHQRLLSIRARLMREALHNRDFTFRLPTDRLYPGERDLQTALNDMGSEINRLLAHSEVESWQRLTRVLTHEIMNSIAPIQSITQAYITSSLVKGTALEEGIRAIYETCVSMSAFVNSYRKLTQLQPADIQPLDLAPFLNSLRNLYPDIECNISIENTDTVDTDRGMLRQVATNIIKNAIEAGARRIDIRIARNQECGNAGKHEKKLLLLISNNGQPIMPEIAHEVFIPFFTTKKSGNGIGLSLARQMMMACGGDICLADKPVVGYNTTFVVVMQNHSARE